MHKAIPQVDGQSEDLSSELTFSFISHFGKYDLEYTLKELFPEALNAKLVSHKKVEHEKNANHICIVTLETACDELFTWPEMNNIQKEVITEIKLISACWYGGGVPPHYDTIIYQQAHFLLFMLTSYYTFVSIEC